MTFGNSAYVPAWRNLAHCLFFTLLFIFGLSSLPALASTGHVSEANLVLPDLGDLSLVSFLGGMSGWSLLSYGLLILSLIHI